MDILKGLSDGSPPTGPKEWTPRRRKKIRKVDISLPKDFVHVSTVKHRKKVSVDLKDPVIQSFLRRAEVNEEDLCNPEISRVVTNFIERVGLDAIRHESETGGFLSRHDGYLSQVPVEKEGNLSVPDVTYYLDPSTKSEDDKSLIFCAEHDIEITSELDDVFVSHVDTSVSGNSDESGEGEIDAPKTRTSETSEEGKRIDHDTFLFELKAAIRKREIRVKKKIQNEEMRGEEIWSDLRPVVTSKRRVSFFEPEISPSPKPVRTVHTRWDLTDDSSDITDIGLNEVEADGDKNTDERVHSGDSDDLDGNSAVDGAVNASGKAKLPLVGGTKALNKILSSDNSDILSNEDQAISELNNALIILPSDQLLHDNSSGMQLQSEDEDVLLETESPLVEAADTSKEEMTVNKGTDEIEIEIPTKSSVEVKKPIKKGGIAHWLFGKKNAECPPKIVDTNVTSEEGSGNVENEVTESRVIEDNEKLGSAEKRKDDKGRKSKLKAPFRQEQKLVDDPKELHALSLKDITNLESPRKKEDKTSFSFFTGKKKHASVANVAEVKLPKPSGSPTIRNSDEENNESHGNISDSSVNINLHAKKETGRAKRPRMAVRKKDIQVMRDMRHVTHITWDPDRRGFLLNHTDDEELRKFLLQEKLCVEMPRYKQRRNSYSLAVDRLDSDYEDCLSKPGERRSFSLSSASRVFSRGEKKRAPLPRPKSDLPTHENVIYF
ncbi:uncharacterized protein LOC124168091 isoform X2 [Ischnura elegans]|uniref:uncharacterized protein LOC124168091 isoform X2 n=1 Tax=Ischnura elegans TaxID=197161 RepID=UPI001ED89A3E|nr:uncharacterized protein LOC124168091 isoform X2 [Ischnura elegans]